MKSIQAVHQGNGMGAVNISQAEAVGKPLADW
jgi:hypothetical protein